jgi:hypothetical protein
VIATAAAEMLVYRGALAATLAMGAVEAVQAMARPASWNLHGVARLPGVVALGGRRARMVTLAVVIAAGVAFWADLVPPLSTAVLVGGFVVLVSLYLSLDWMGYVVESADGQPRRQVTHHLHLAGLCGLGALAGALAAPALRAPTGSLSTAGPGDWVMVHAIWACIGAHYLVSGLAKLRGHGFRWADRRLFPFYSALNFTFVLGDSGRWRPTRLSSLMMAAPSLGVLLLLGALASELSAATYPFWSSARAVVGTLLLVLHMFSRLTFWVDFRENMVLLAAFSYLSLPAIGYPGPADWSYMMLTAAILAAVVAASLLSGERVFPLARLGMFAYGYRPQGVILFADEWMRSVFPVRDLLGGLTGGLSKEYAMCLAVGRDTDALFRDWQDRARRHMRSCARSPGPLYVWLRTLSVDDVGIVHTHDQRLTDVPFWHGDA